MEAARINIKISCDMGDIDCPLKLGHLISKLNVSTTLKIELEMSYCIDRY